VIDEQKPTLTLCYLPHLDYDLQRFGPNDPRIAKALGEIDALCGELFEFARQRSLRVIVLSEYGITEVSDAVHVNRVLREAGLLRVREELGHEQLDAGASAAFAVADHQIAHVYVRDAARVSEVKALLARVPGVEHVLDRRNSGPSAWTMSGRESWCCSRRPIAGFSYYFWLDDARPRLRAHRRYPPEARLRPGRALPRSGHHVPEAARRAKARGAEARLSQPPRRDPAGRKVW
jgi:hypothetical protein